MLEVMFSKVMAKGCGDGLTPCNRFSTCAKGAATGSPGLVAARIRYSRRGRMISEYMEGTGRYCVYTHVFSGVTVSHSAQTDSRFAPELEKHVGVQLLNNAAVPAFAQ